MTRKDLSLIFCLLTIGLLIGLCFRNCKPSPTQAFHTNIDSIIDHNRILADSLLREVDARDSVISALHGHTDTIIQSTNKYIDRYHNSTDTIYKLLTCDSIIVGFAALQKDYYRNDTLHQNNEKGLKMAVTYLSTALDTCQNAYDKDEKTIFDLNKKVQNNRRIAWTSVGVGVTAVVVAILK